MNKEKYDAIIVVEGTSDASLLSSFLDADIVTTNGSEVSRGTIYYLKKARNHRTIVVLTDPDSPGKRIRDVLDREIPGLLHAYIRKEEAIKHHKVGVAESSKKAVLEALSHLIPSSPKPNASLTMNDLVELSLMGEESSSRLRDALSIKLHLGQVNAKTLLKRLNAIGLSRQELEDALNG